MTYVEHFKWLCKAFPPMGVVPLHWEMEGYSVPIPLLLQHTEASPGDKLIFKVEDLPEWNFYMRIPYEKETTYLVRAFTKVNAGEKLFYHDWYGNLQELKSWERTLLHRMLRDIKFNFVLAWYKEKWGGYPSSIKHAYFEWYATCLGAIYKNFMGDVKGYTPKPFLGIKLLWESRNVEWNAWKRY
jgi:hypothetical protein